MNDEQDKNLERSLFKGTWVYSPAKTIKLQNIRFSKADFDGTKFIDVELINCNIDNADLRTLYFKNCQFVQVDFTLSNINDTYFEECTFIDCIFKGAQLSNNKFVDCTIDGFELNGGTALLNEFIKTSFNNAVFKNVFYYNVFKECIFDRVSYEAYLLGYNYEIKSVKGKDMKYVLMGKSVDCDFKTLLEKTEEIYKDRYMLLNIDTLHLNFEYAALNYDSALINSFKTIKKFCEKEILIQAELIDFLRRIISYMLKEGLLSTDTIIELYAITKSIINTKGQSLIIQKPIEKLRILHNELYCAYIGFLGKKQITIEL